MDLKHLRSVFPNLANSALLLLGSSVLPTTYEIVLPVLPYTCAAYANAAGCLTPQWLCTWESCLQNHSNPPGWGETTSKSAQLHLSIKSPGVPWQRWSLTLAHALTAVLIPLLQATEEFSTKLQTKRSPHSSVYTFIHRESSRRS